MLWVYPTGLPFRPSRPGSMGQNGRGSEPIFDTFRLSIYIIIKMTNTFITASQLDTNEKKTIQQQKQASKMNESLYKIIESTKL